MSPHGRQITTKQTIIPSPDEPSIIVYVSVYNSDFRELPVLFPSKYQIYNGSNQNEITSVFTRRQQYFQFHTIALFAVNQSKICQLLLTLCKLLVVIVLKPTCNNNFRVKKNSCIIMVKTKSFEMQL